MNLELHHFFILVEPGAKVADLLCSLGMKEGARNKHEGQGTSNRRFNFSNGTLEILWINDVEEATQGPGQKMYLYERSQDVMASPFGLVFNRKDNSSLKMPFEGWHYQPDYFKPPMGFHVGQNSSYLLEPLCVYMPFIEPDTSVGKVEEGVFSVISNVNVSTTSESLSDTLGIVSTTDRLEVNHGKEHLMEIIFDNHRHDQSRDLRPDLPLIIRW